MGVVGIGAPALGDAKIMLVSQNRHQHLHPRVRKGKNNVQIISLKHVSATMVHAHGISKPARMVAIITDVQTRHHLLVLLAKRSALTES